MPRRETPFKFLARFMVDRFCGSVTIKLEAGKVTHVETETRQAWRYRDLPDEMRSERSEVVRSF